MFSEQAARFRLIVQVKNPPSDGGIGSPESRLKIVASAEAPQLS
jgi:hypothetical protein